MTVDTRIRTAVRLKHGIDEMAGRYGASCIRRACLEPGTAGHDAATRQVLRRYRALLRLTHALAELAAGVDTKEGPR